MTDGRKRDTSAVEDAPIDKSTWGDGPWQHEPDGWSWMTEAGLLGAIIRHPSFGNLNGYVAVPPEHPWHGKSYGACLDGHGDDCFEHAPDTVTDAHGGLTFSGFAIESAYFKRALGDIGPGWWWFGFDTAHGWDYCPAMAARERSLSFPMPRIDERAGYRTADYVRREVEQLATQIKAAS